MNAPKHDVVAIASDGRPVMMRVPDPRAFALHKAWLSTRQDREPVKKGRDRAQAVIVARIILAHLPTFEFDPTQLRYFSAEMLQQARRTLEGVRLPGIDV